MGTDSCVHIWSMAFFANTTHNETARDWHLSVRHTKHLSVDLAGLITFETVPSCCQRTDVHLWVPDFHVEVETLSESVRIYINRPWMTQTSCWWSSPVIRVASAEGNQEHADGFLWHSQGCAPWIFFPQGQTANGKYVCDILKPLRVNIRRKLLKLTTKLSNMTTRPLRMQKQSNSCFANLFLTQLQGEAQPRVSDHFYNGSDCLKRCDQGGRTWWSISKHALQSFFPVTTQSSLPITSAHRILFLLLFFFLSPKCILVLGL